MLTWDLKDCHIKLINEDTRCKFQNVNRESDQKYREAELNYKKAKIYVKFFDKTNVPTTSKCEYCGKEQ